MTMDNQTHCLLLSVNTLILFGLLVSAGALAQDNDYAAASDQSLAQFAPAFQSPSTNDCYKRDRNIRLAVRVRDLSALWHYATRILMPTAAGASAAPHTDAPARKMDKGVVWRVGTENSGVVVSATMVW
jgi:hypothetical protein